MEYQQLHAVKLGVAGGVVSALCVALTVVSGIYGLFGGFPMWNALIVDMYGTLGFSVSWVGVFLGAIYSFIDGFIMTWLAAVFYNWMLQ